LALSGGPPDHEHGVRRKRAHPNLGTVQGIEAEPNTETLARPVGVGAKTVIILAVIAPQTRLRVTDVARKAITKRCATCPNPRRIPHLVEGKAIRDTRDSTTVWRPGHRNKAGFMTLWQKETRSMSWEVNEPRGNSTHRASNPKRRPNPREARSPVHGSTGGKDDDVQVGTKAAAPESERSPRTRRTVRLGSSVQLHVPTTKTRERSHKPTGWAPPAPPPLPARCKWNLIIERNGVDQGFHVNNFKSLYNKSGLRKVRLLVYQNAFELECNEMDEIICEK
jgi:hypothetical protein